MNNPSFLLYPVISANLPAISFFIPTKSILTVQNNRERDYASQTDNLNIDTITSFDMLSTTVV